MTARIARRKTACNQPAQTPASQPADARAEQHATRLAKRTSQHTAEAQVVVAPASKPAAASASKPAAQAVNASCTTPTSPQAHPAEGQPASIAASSVSDTTETLQSLLDLRNRKTQRQRATGASKGTGKIDRVTAEAAMEESKKAVTPCTTPINRVWTGEGKGRKLAGINILMPQADNLEEFRCDKAPCRHASKKFSTLAYLVHHLKCCKEVASTCHMARKHKCPALQTGHQGEAHRGAGEKGSTPTKAAPTRSVVTQTPKKFLQSTEQLTGTPAVRDTATRVVEKSPIPATLAQEVGADVRTSQEPSCSKDKFDPGCYILARLFNCCRTLGQIPESWKTSRTVLIHKGEDLDMARNWRPISLICTVAKL